MMFYNIWKSTRHLIKLFLPKCLYVYSSYWLKSTGIYSLGKISLI